MGDCPDWYAHIQAAKYLNIDPEKLLDISTYWKDRALIALGAEAQARATLEQQ